MKKILTALVAMVALLLFCASVFGAKYVVKKNDTLSEIAEKINYGVKRVKDLASLNSIRNPDLIFPGQKIFYVTKRDLVNAKAWAKKRRSELRPSDPNYKYFGLVIEDIERGEIRFSVVKEGGTHASLILVFASAWELWGKA